MRRFFGSGTFLKVMALAITLVVLFYAEEDWRGARAWAATKAMWEARGVSFNAESYFPSKVPEAENIAALPMFRLKPDPKEKANLIPAPLDRALRDDHQHANQLLPSINYLWQRGKRPDLAQLRSGVAAVYTEVFSASPKTTDSLEQMQELYPFVAELEQAGADRPYFELENNYDSYLSSRQSFYFIAAQLKLTRVLDVHALLALDEKQPKVALADVRIMLKTSAGIGRQPSLIAGFMANASASMAVTVIGYGLAIHAWNDAQLSDVQALLSLDVLKSYQHALRSECITSSLPMMQYLKTRTTQDQPNLTTFDNLFSHLSLCNGWIDQNRCHVADDLLGAADLVDPKAHRVFIDRANDFAQHAERRWPLAAPWNILSTAGASQLLNPFLQFTHTQVLVDEARLACALERYRLARGLYPVALTALIPAYIGKLPPDPINGEVYHYQARSDGTFLLYSVGWNQTDEGGVVIFDLDSTAVDDDSPLKHGDWTWPALH